MSSFVCLTKQLIKNTLKPTFADEKEKKKYIATVIGLVIAFGIPIVLGVVGAYGLIKASVETGYLSEVLSTIFLSAQVVTIFFGLFAYVNIMYFSKDNEFLFTLPLKNITVFWAKLIVILIYELIFSAIIVIPMSIVGAVAITASGLSVSIGYFIMMILATFLLPLMALLFIALLSYPLMFILKYFKKHPTVGAVVVIIFVVAIYMAIYLPILLNTSGAGEIVSGDIGSGESIGSGQSDSQGEEISATEIYAKILPSFSKVGRYSYHTYFLAKAMVSGFSLSGFGYAMAFFGIIIGFAAIGTLLAGLLYRKLTANLLEGGGEASVKKQNAPVVQLDLSKALFRREMKSIFKNTTLFIQIGMMTLLPPILVFFLGKINGASASSSVNAGFIAMGIAEIMIKLMGASSVAASVAISREGEGIFMLKTYPVDLSKIVEVKIKVANCLSIVMIALSSIAFMFTGSATVIDFAALLISNIIYVAAINRYSVYRDLKRPKVHWKNIVEITNNNLATLFPLLVSGLGGVVAMIICFVFTIIPLNRYIVSSIYLLVTVAISVVYYFAIKAKTKDNVNKLFEQIE